MELTLTPQEKDLAKKIAINFLKRHNLTSGTIPRDVIAEICEKISDKIHIPINRLPYNELTGEAMCTDWFEDAYKGHHQRNIANKWFFSYSNPDTPLDDDFWTDIENSMSVKMMLGNKTTAPKPKKSFSHLEHSVRKMF